MASVFKRGGKKAKGYWYASWKDHTGKRHTQCTKTTDKATAERIARKHEADAALRRDGVIDPTLDAIGKESKRTIEAHLADYESKLRAANSTEDHVTRTVGYIRKIAGFAEFTTVGDINADGVNRYAGMLRDLGRSARTIQAHLNAIKGFTRWLSSHHKLPRDPLASVKKPNPKADRRRERRIILPEEWQRLDVATRIGPERYGMTGGERRLLYLTAIQTGLRSSELRSLTRGRLYFDSNPPYITCKAGSTKNRKEARQYIQPELAAELKAHVETKAPQATVFAMPDRTRLATMLRDDLAAARKSWIAEVVHDPQEYAQRQESDFLRDTNHEGEVTDFHSLRHSCGAWLAMTGAHPKVIQSVMRHQTITLTMDTYGHLFPGQESDAVGRMRQMFPQVLPEAFKATGTDNAQAPGIVQRARSATARDTEQWTATQCEATRSGGPDHYVKPASPKPMAHANLGEKVRPAATPCDSGRGGARTLTPVTRYGILSPVRLPIPPLGQEVKDHYPSRA